VRSQRRRFLHVSPVLLHSLPCSSHKKLVLACTHPCSRNNRPLELGLSL
jgi:hypothetical protein